MEDTPPQIAPPLPHAKPSRLVPVVVVLAVLVVLGLGGLLVVRAEAHTNKVSLAEDAKPVTVVEAKATTYRAGRTYVGTLDPWVESKIGPQLVSAYVDTVLVRPGAMVKKGEVLATLDCRNSNAASQAVAAGARALDARLTALAHESARYKGLLDGGFAAANEVEQKAAMTTAQEADVNAAKAKLVGTALEVSDCILRAPFDGEIATRTIDPGAFVRPGTPIVSVIDRSTIRLTADAPEIDFGVTQPGTEVRVHILSTGRDLVAKITRRAPQADLTTRTVHFEIDIPDPNRQIPVGTTGEIRVDVGEAVVATEIPLSTASVRGAKAILFEAVGDVAKARTLKVLGESGGSLFVEPSLAGGAKVVSEGRALLSDGDRIRAKTAEAAPPTSAAPPVPSPASEVKK